MTAPSPPTTRPRPPPGGPAGAAGMAGSLLLHGLLALYVSLRASVPSLDLDLQLPSEVEFGLTDEATVESGPPSAPAPDEIVPPPSDPPPAEGEESTVVVDAGP